MDLRAGQVASIGKKTTAAVRSSDCYPPASVNLMAEINSSNNSVNCC